MAIEDCEALFLVFGGLTGLTIDVWETLFLALGDVFEDLDTLFLVERVLTWGGETAIEDCEALFLVFGGLTIDVSETLLLLCLLGRSRGVVSASIVVVTRLFILLV